MQKKLLKSTNIWQSYSKNKSGPVFLTHSVDTDIEVFHLRPLMLVELSWVATAVWGVDSGLERRIVRWQNRKKVKWYRIIECAINVETAVKTIAWY